MWYLGPTRCLFHFYMLHFTSVEPGSSYPDNTRLLAQRRNQWLAQRHFVRGVVI